MKQLKQYFFSMLICLAFVNVGSIWAQDQVVGITNGKFGFYQVFDCQRSPAYPTANAQFILRNLKAPLRDNRTTYTLEQDEYIQFFYIDGSCTSGSVGIKRFNASGELIEVISSGGKIWGLEDEGFLYVSTVGDYGTFVANSYGYSYGESVTYTTTSGVTATCDQLENYMPGTAPLSVSSLTIEATMVSFNSQPGIPSVSQSFKISGTKLTNNVNINVIGDFEISTDDVIFSQNLILPQTGGELSNQPVQVYVRLSGTAPEGSLTGSIKIETQGVVVNPIHIYGIVSSDIVFKTPNTFTPNGDGINDTWVIPNISNYSGYKLTIFNNLGATLYESSNYNNDWDGKYKGNDLPAGTYYYIFSKDTDIYKGFITILRAK